MNAAPKLTVGLPVYNGANYLAESLNSLLGQSYPDFELIISDNASTDGTAAICREYARRDRRISYFRQRRNIGLSPNHNFVVGRATGELFKWASNDDLYGRDLLKLCVDALAEYPQAVLAHSWTAMIDRSGQVTSALLYPLATASQRPPERFRSLLFDNGGDDDCGVMRTDVLRRTAMKDSYHHADRTIVAEMALNGPFLQVPGWLYFRRDHPERASALPTVRGKCATMDPRRADRLRHPVARLYVEYLWGYIAAIRNTRLTAADRRECYVALAQWAASRAWHDQPGPGGPPADTGADVRVSALVVGQEGKLVVGQEGT